MPLEDLEGPDKFITALAPENPAGVDSKQEGDNHIRGVKNVLQNTFPNFDEALEATPGEVQAAVDYVKDPPDFSASVSGFNLREEVNLAGLAFHDIELSAGYDYEFSIASWKPAIDGEGLLLLPGDAVSLDPLLRRNYRGSAGNGAANTSSTVFAQWSDNATSINGLVGQGNAPTDLGLTVTHGRLLNQDDPARPTLWTYDQTGQQEGTQRPNYQVTFESLTAKVHTRLRVQATSGNMLQGLLRVYRRGRTQAELPATIDLALIPSTLLSAEAGNPPTINRAVNIANVVRTGAGQFTVEFVQPYADAFYAALASSESSMTGFKPTKTPSSIEITVRDANGALVDRAFTLTCFGPLAP